MTCPVCGTELEQPDPNNKFCPKCKTWNPHEHGPLKVGQGKDLKTTLNT